MEPHYRLNDPSRAARLRELAGVDNPTALDSELALVRLLQEEAVNNGETGVAIALSNVIGKLAQASEIAKYRRGDMLCKAAVLQLATQVVDLVASSVAGKFDGWEDVLENVGRSVVQLVSSAKNTDPDGMGRIITVNSEESESQSE
jgi:hypothetical protein